MPIKLTGGEILELDEQRENSYIEQIERVRLKVLEKIGGTQSCPVEKLVDVAVSIVKEVAADRRQDRIDARHKGK